MKYSPIGASVNLASRLEGANKYFGTSILISEETRQQLFTSFPLRRVGPVMVKGSLQPVQVFQLLTEDQSKVSSAEVLADYETALKSFEQSDFESAIKTLENILATRADSLCECLLAQAKINLTQPGQPLAIRLHEK